MEQQDIRTKIAALVENVIRTFPVPLNADLFTSLEPLSKLIGEDVREIALNIQKQLASHDQQISTKMLPVMFDSANVNKQDAEEWVNGLTNVYADIEVRDVNVSENKFSFKAGFSGRSDTKPNEIGIRIEEYLTTNDSVLINNISVNDASHDALQRNSYSKHLSHTVDKMYDAL